MNRAWKLAALNALIFALLVLGFSSFRPAQEVSPFAPYMWFFDETPRTRDWLLTQGWSCDENSHFYGQPSTCWTEDATFKRITATPNLSGIVSWIMFVPRPDQIEVADLVEQFGHWERLRRGVKDRWADRLYYLMIWEELYAAAFDSSYLTFWTPVTTIQWRRVSHVR